MSELSPSARAAALGGGRHSGIDVDDPLGSHRTPPGTPPPPYPAPMLGDMSTSTSTLNEVGSSVGELS